MRLAKAVWTLGASLALWFVAPSSDACTVCFGKSDSAIVDGVQTSVLFMIGVTYFLLVGGVVTFLLLRRRALQQEQRQADSA